jgi:hypothetical protein
MTGELISSASLPQQRRPHLATIAAREECVIKRNGAYGHADAGWTKGCSQSMQYIL